MDSMNMLSVLSSIQIERLENAKALNNQLREHVLMLLRELDGSEALKKLKKAAGFKVLEMIGRDGEVE